MLYSIIMQFLFGLILFEQCILANKDADKSLSLCLDLNEIRLKNMDWHSGSDLFEAGTTATIYAYSPTNGRETFKSMKIPLFNELVNNSLPTHFEFAGNISNFACWQHPSFHTLNIRFKIYQWYHTALKAEYVIAIPNKRKNKEYEQNYEFDMETLAYEYDKVTVEVDMTFSWIQSQLLDDSEYENVDILPDNVMFDSDEELSLKGPSAGNGGGGSDSLSSIMLFAALFSAILGAIILINTCIWGYKQYQRRDYDQIKETKGDKYRLGIFTKISLRNKSIMHPKTSSYTSAV